MEFEEWMEHAVEAIEIVGVAVLSIGLILSSVGAARTLLGGDPTAAYERARRGFGRSIVLGLDILIIAVFIQTVAIDHSLESAVILGVIVLARIILSFSLSVEFDGAVPWRRASAAALMGGRRTKTG